MVEAYGRAHQGPTTTTLPLFQEAPSGYEIRAFGNTAVAARDTESGSKRCPRTFLRRLIGGLRPQASDGDVDEGVERRQGERDRKGQRRQLAPLGPTHAEPPS